MFPDLPFRRDMSDGDGDKESKFTVLMCNAPAALWELDFLSSKEGTARLGSSLWLSKASEALAGGVLHYLGLDAPQEPVETPTDNLQAIIGIDKAIEVLRETRLKL
jgi:hypothetical protein